MDERTRLEEMIDEELMVLGYELVKLELSLRGRKKIVRLFIDRPEGVTLDNCVEVTAALGFALDGEDFIKGPYNLEVSSPGIDRPLTKPAHFERFKGHSAKIQYNMEDGNKRTIICEIGDAGETHRVATEKGDLEIPYDRILRANLHGEKWEISKKRSRGAKRDL